MTSDSPWAGLESGEIDTRRVDASARWDWFWAVMPGSDVALVLKLSKLPKPLPDLPKLRNLEVRFQTLPGGPILYVRLKDSAQLELFETLCRDVMAAGELAQMEAEALKRAIGRTFRWHYLLKGGRPGVLAEEVQKGLIGEIEVLKLLMETVGPKRALEAWTGPTGAPKDFELRNHCIEVKARRGAAQPFVRISNEFQLADVPGTSIWLGILAVDKVEAPHGQTLTERVEEVTTFLETSCPSALANWDLRLAEAGFDLADDYSGWRWQVSVPDFYAVTAYFPRLEAPAPIGISNVSYSLAIAACAPFKTEWDRIRSELLHEER